MSPSVVISVLVVLAAAYTLHFTRLGRSVYAVGGSEQSALLMGLPVARDMEGRVLTEILEEDFARAHPLTFVPSYESLAVTPVAGSPDVELPLLPEETP